MAKVIGRAYVKHAVALARGRRQSLKLGKSGVSTNSAVIRAS
jgi:hypothetical protein